LENAAPILFQLAGEVKGDTIQSQELMTEYYKLVQKFSEMKMKAMNDEREAHDLARQTLNKERALNKILRQQVENPCPDNRIVSTVNPIRVYRRIHVSMFPFGKA
jgi:hypothetical protein